jgi:hypothetical protein
MELGEPESILSTDDKFSSVEDVADQIGRAAFKHRDSLLSLSDDVVNGALLRQQAHVESSIKRQENRLSN